MNDNTRPSPKDMDLKRNGHWEPYRKTSMLFIMTRSLGRCSPVEYKAPWRTLLAYEQWPGYSMAHQNSTHWSQTFTMRSWAPREELWGHLTCPAGPRGSRPLPWWTWWVLHAELLMHGWELLDEFAVITSLRFTFSSYIQNQHRTHLPPSSGLGRTPMDACIHVRTRNASTL